MTKSKQRQSLSGTVLIMILTVMFVLIIMLMATLTVVTTASQRIYTKFEENQAYYTSRSALEVITSKMLQDGGYIGTNTNISAPAGTDEYQGFQMQAALYTIKVKGTAITDPCNTLDVYGTVQDKEFIEYEVSLPTIGSPSDTYGNFSDDRHVYIKMEVIERVYDEGAAGTAESGNRADDKMKVKITATSEVNGVEGTASVLIEAGPKTGANNTTRAVTTLGGATMEPNNCAILGGIATLGDVVFDNTGDYWGDFYIGQDADEDGKGEATVENKGGGSRVTLIGDDWYYINGSVISPTSNNIPLQGFETISGTIPVVYIAGDYKVNQGTSGTSANPITLIVAGDFEASGDYTHYGDLYVMGTCKPLGNALNVYGNLYVKGNADFSTCQNGSNVYKDSPSSTTTGNAYFNSNVTFRLNSGAIKAAIEGTVFLQDEVNANKVIGLSWTAVPGAVPMPDVDKDSLPGYIYIELPDGRSNKVPTSGSLYTQFYRYHDPEDEGCITASEYAFTSQEDFNSYIYSQQRIHEYYNAEAASAIQITSATGGLFTSPGKYRMTPGQYMKIVEFNTGGEVELFLDPGSYSRGDIGGVSGGKVIVYPGTTLKVYCVPGNYSFDNFCFTTSQVESGAKLYAGETVDPAAVGDSTAALMSIPTTFYVEGESTMSFSNSGSYIIGHIYAPRASINANSSGTSSFVDKLYYNNIPYGSNKYNGNSYGFTIVGSLLADSYLTGGSSKGSVAYVKTDDASTPPPAGQPFLNFKEVKYSRN